jgi:hypothetical protein
MPYDVPNQESWRETAQTEGYPALEVAPGVRRFRGVGLGSYSFFNQGQPVFASQAFKVPPGLASGSLENVLTIFLSRAASGGIRHVVNETGGASTTANADIAVRVSRFPAP